MKFLIFLGTVRDSTPPRPARLGLRVAKSILSYLQNTYSDHQFELIDPLDYPLEPVFKPQFAYAKGKAPEPLNILAEKIATADGYVMVSPEYNHSMSPALANLLNHFASSSFAYKPSAIVTYSAGQWGGMRAAVGMRTFLAELGCLSVSAMIHIPKAQEVFNEDGSVQATEDENAWMNYYSRTFNQLMWWASATNHYKDEVNPREIVGDFKTSPTQRNAP
ncbi:MULTISPECIES: NAD(P)H-dependent oxidoreductase [unclassified Pseudoalteromonas]|uniref:NADPH-dependent FMN reductase n=1 Tax=unclassified Pseudoalteromonas TaxID=194690 RepID=UPI0025B3579D|nr:MULTISPECIES: NAD(P)H-dependent oxidoreductase [unclassified Pseudoalteromonas]MDN3380235.1 NAD(P)H-dependent oxidoreductase [Pseudoalteromonas sp. APC 3893]MDN3388625.1 NAD(P)H-dependent oxidoreductase [Pseudoalteromonas sp. APC 4017]